MIALEGPASENGGGVAELEGWSPEAVAALAAGVRGHDSTAGEVALLCKDLQVRGGARNHTCARYITASRA